MNRRRDYRQFASDLEGFYAPDQEAVTLCPKCGANLWDGFCGNCKKLIRPGKMGFEPRQRIVTTGYGKAGYFDIDGQRVWTASEVERQWLGELALCIRAGQVRSWKWQPQPPVPVRYKHGRTECTRTYLPDAWVDWLEEREVWYEIKHGRIEQKAGNNIEAFCLTYPERRMVLVWKGSVPKKGTTKKQWDKIAKLVHHVWYLR